MFREMVMFNEPITNFTEENHVELISTVCTNDLIQSK